MGIAYYMILVDKTNTYYPGDGTTAVTVIVLLIRAAAVLLATRALLVTVTVLVARIRCALVGLGFPLTRVAVVGLSGPAIAALRALAVRLIGGAGSRSRLAGGTAPFAGRALLGR